MIMDGNSSLLYLVESEQGVGQRLQIFLESAGYNVEWFQDAPSALGVFADEVETPPAFILLRAELPDVSGFLICDRLKHDPEWETIPVLILYSDGESEELGEHQESETHADSYVFVDEHDQLLYQFRELEQVHESAEILLTSVKSSMPLQPLPSFGELPPLEPLPPLSSASWPSPSQTQLPATNGALPEVTERDSQELLLSNNPGVATLSLSGAFEAPSHNLLQVGSNARSGEYELSEEVPVLLENQSLVATQIRHHPMLTGEMAPLSQEEINSYSPPPSPSMEADSVDDFMNLQQQLKSAELELINWKTRYMEIERKYEEASSHLPMLEEREAELMGLEQRLEELQFECSRLVDEKEALSLEATDLQQAFDQQAQELQETLEQQSQELRAALTRQAEELEEEISEDVGEQLEQLQEELEAERERAANLQAKLASLLEDDETTATHNYSHEEIESAQIVGEHTLTGVQAETLDALREREEELESLQAELEAARREAVEARTALESLQDETANVSPSEDDEDTGTSDALDLLREELESALSEVDILRSSQVALEDELEAVQESRALLLQELEELHETQDIDDKGRLLEVLTELEATKQELAAVLQAQSEAHEDEADDVTVNVVDEEKQQLKDRVTQLSTELAETTIDLKELQHALSLRESELEALRNPEEEEDPGLTATEVALLNNAHDAELEKLELLLEQYKQSNKELTGEKTEMLLSLNEIRKEMEETQSAFESIQAEHQGFEDRRAEYDEKLTRLSLLVEEKRTLERQLRETQSELSSFEREVEGLQQDLSSVSEERNRYRDEVLQVQNELVANREEIDQLRDMETELHKQVEKAQRSFDNLQAQVEQSASSKDGNREEMEALERELIQLRKQNATLEQDLYDAVDKLQALQRHAGKASSALEDVEDLRARQEARLQEMREQAERYQQELENRAEKITTLRKEKEVLEEELDAVRSEQGQLAEDRDQLRARIEQLVEDLEENQSNWEQKFKTQQGRFEREIAALEDKLEEASSRLKFADEQKEHEVSQRLHNQEMKWDSEKDRLLQEQMAQEMAWEEEKKEFLDTQVTLESSWSEERERLMQEQRLREEEWNRKLELVNKKNERALKLQAEDFLEQIAIQEAMQREEREDLQAQYEETILQEKNLLFARHQTELDRLRSELDKAQRHSNDAFESEKRQLLEELSQKELLLKETLEARELELSTELNLEREALKEQLSMSQQALFEDFREREEEKEGELTTLRRELEAARKEVLETREANASWWDTKLELESRLEDLETLRKHDRESLRSKYRSAAQTVESLEKKIQNLEQQQRESVLKEKELREKLVQQQTQREKLQSTLRNFLTNLDE